MRILATIRGQHLVLGDGDEAQRDEEVEEGVVKSANTLKVQVAALLTCGARNIKTKDLH